jgi:hypothetical protein
MHGFIRRKAKKHAVRNCFLCKGTEKVDVEIARRFLDAFYDADFVIDTTG